MRRAESITVEWMPMKKYKIAVLDDYQNVALQSGDVAVKQSENELRRSPRLHRPVRDKTPGIL
jgi:hypothetical protein